MRRLVRLALVLACAAASGCGGGDSKPAAVPPGNVELRVMTFNVWYGGVSVDFGQIAAAINAADPDVLGVQEPEADLKRIAEAAGYPYVDPSLHLISRYPIFESELKGVRFAYVEVARDQVVAVENVHLTCCPYGPNLVAAGKTVEDVLALERRTRLPEAESYAAVMRKLIGEDIPVFMTGDFNSPSSHDWTQAAVDARGLPYPVAVAGGQGARRRRHARLLSRCPPRSRGDAGAHVDRRPAAPAHAPFRDARPHRLDPRRRPVDDALKRRCRRDRRPGRRHRHRPLGLRPPRGGFGASASSPPRRRTP